MSFESGLVTVLTGTAGISALVSSRVRPIEGVQGETRPFIAYSLQDEEDPAPTFAGPSTTRRVSFDVICVADTYEACRNLSEQVRDRLKLYAGSPSGASVAIRWTKLETQTDVEQATAPGTEKPIYVRSQTYRAMYRAS